MYYKVLCFLNSLKKEDWRRLGSSFQPAIRSAAAAYCAPTLPAGFSNVLNASKDTKVRRR